MVRGDKSDAILKDPASLKGQQILLTDQLDGRVLGARLPARNGASREATCSSSTCGQAQIIQRVRSNNGDARGRLGAEQLHARETARARSMLCSGKDAGAVVPGALVVARRLRQGEPGEHGEVSRRLPARWCVDEGEPQGDARADDGNSTRRAASRSRDACYGAGDRPAADLRPRRAAEGPDRPAARRPGRTAGSASIGEYLIVDRHAPGGAGHQGLHHRRVHEARRRRTPS